MNKETSRPKCPRCISSKVLSRGPAWSCKECKRCWLKNPVGFKYPFHKLRTKDPRKYGELRRRAKGIKTREETYKYPFSSLWSSDERKYEELRRRAFGIGPLKLKYKFSKLLRTNPREYFMQFLEEQMEDLLRGE